MAAAGPLPAGASGSVKGTVRLSGKAPPNPLVELAPGHACFSSAGRSFRLQEVVVGPGRGLANVLVRLEGAGLAAAAGPAPLEPIVIEQWGCAYFPRTLGARAGQTLRVVNLDNFYHNVRSVSDSGRDFDISQPLAGMEFDFELTAEQEMLRLDCGAHPWTHAFVGISEHPWFAVTTADGRFDLEGVPAGAYEVVLWHERFGTLRQKVSIAAGAAATVDLAYAVE